MKLLARARRRSVLPGQAMVEFALTSLIFLTTVLTLFEGGRVMVDYADLAYAVQEGGRAAALPAPQTNSTADVCAKIANKAALISIPCGSVTIDTGGTFANRTTGGKAKVTGTYTFTPIISSIFGGSLSFTLSYTAIFTVE